MHNNQQAVDPKTFITTLKIIHGAMLLGMIVFGIVAYNTVSTINTSFEMQENLFVFIVPIVAMIAYFASGFIFKKIVQEVKPSDNLQVKIGLYLKGSIAKYAFLEGAGLFAIFAFMNNGYFLYLLIAALLLLFMYTQRPTLSNITQELPLNKEETQQFIR